MGQRGCAFLVENRALLFLVQMTCKRYMDLTCRYWRHRGQLPVRKEAGKGAGRGIWQKRSGIRIVLSSHCCHQNWAAGSRWNKPIGSIGEDATWIFLGLGRNRASSPGPVPPGLHSLLSMDVMLL